MVLLVNVNPAGKLDACKLKVIGLSPAAFKVNE